MNLTYAYIFLFLAIGFEVLVILSEVVNISDFLGIGDKVARTYPVVNIKG